MNETEPICTRDHECTATSHFGDCESMPSMPTVPAIKDCAEWLQSCIHIGWPKSSLDELQALWWKYHDTRRNLKR
jgi:hypothetical protein